MYYLNQIFFSYSHSPILKGVSLHLHCHEPVALIGQNGTGKTTLLRIAAGELKPDAGSIGGKLKVGYLPQYFEGKEGRILEFFGSYPLDLVQKALQEVGLSNLDQNRAVGCLSGGEQTRLGLAKVLLMKPEVLLLDEPTNNLDQEGLRWLTQFIQSFAGAVLFTSHDRVFMDEVAVHTAELKEGKLRIFGGNYSFAKAQQQAEKAAYQARFEGQEQYKKRLQEDIANTKAQAKHVELTTVQVNTRRYAKKVAKKAVVREARLNREMASEDWLQKPQGEEVIYLPLPETKVPAGKVVLDLIDLSKRWGGKPIFQGLNFQMVGPERVWLTGPNGSGKSTLIKLIVDGLNPDTGQAKIGAGLRVGVLTQAGYQFDLSRTAKAELLSTGEHPTRCIWSARALGLTVCDLEQPISLLSRGQQTKLAFAKLLLGNPQFLIFDEPTNHIELETREAIEQALQSYQGAILVASHDRFFVQTLKIDRELKLG